MKKTLIALAVVCALALAAVAGGPISFGVGDDSMKILPARAKYRGTNVTQWAETNLYAQGQVIQNSNRFYMVMNAGTNVAGSTAPTHMSGEGSDGTLTYYKIPTGLRKGLAIVNDSSVDINLSFGYDAKVNKGVTLKANGGAYSLDTEIYQGSVHAIAQSAGSNSVSVIEVD